MEILNSILDAFNFSENTVMWVVFLAAAIRGVCATAAEQIPNAKLGGLSGILDLIGGNKRFGAGSQ